jgi:hypothetical protein
MPRRIDLGRAVLFAGAALLFVSLFLDWYDPGLTAWEAFEALDLVLAGLAVAAMAAAVRPDILPPWAAVAVPGAALLIVVVQLVNFPPAAVGGDLASGAWLALAGTLLMTAGAALSLAAISITVQVRERDVRRRVSAVDRRHAADDDLAEDLDADADEAPRDRRSTSLFGGLGRRGDETVAEPGAAESGIAPAAGSSHGAVAASGAGSVPGAGDADAGDLERTQPMTALPDADEEDPRRP